MRSETLRYSADGVAMKSTLFFQPAPGPRAGVLVFPEAFGLNGHAVNRARRLAAMGFVALACDLHGDGRVVEDLNDAMTLLQPLFDDPTRIRLRATASLKALAERPEVDPARIGAIGFCFPMPLELARAGADLKAVVGFHTMLSTTAPVHVRGSIKARLLVCIGADDPFITSDQRAAFEQEMRKAGADYQMIVYGRTVHSFTNPMAPKHNKPHEIHYSPEADGRSWTALQQVFAETLTEPETPAAPAPAQ